jgi:hypothetical protein
MHSSRFPCIIRLSADITETYRLYLVSVRAAAIP